MATHAAFLRGINVGGRRASKEQLCACFAGEGFEDVATFRTSGNVVFSAQGDEDALIARCEEALRRALGLEVAVLLRTAAQVRAIARHEPFDVDGKVQVVLLPSGLAAKARRDLLALATGDDRLAVKGREVYWLPRNGRVTDSAIDMAGMSRAVGLNTIRTQGTIELMAGKFFAARSLG